MSTQQWSLAPHRYIIVGASILFAIFILAADMKAGPFIRIPVLLVLPVIAVSWYGGLVMGGVLAIGNQRRDTDNNLFADIFSGLLCKPAENPP